MIKQLTRYLKLSINIRFTYPIHAATRAQKLQSKY